MTADGSDPPDRSDTAATTPGTQQARIREALEEGRDQYHALLARVPDNAWERPTGNPAWNVRQLLYHMTTGLRFLPMDVRMILRGSNPTVPPWLFNTANKWYNRWAARSHTRESLAAEYDRQHQKVLDLLVTLSDEDLEKAGTYPDIGGSLTGGRRTIADIFLYVAQHVDEHLEDLLQALQENGR